MTTKEKLIVAEWLYTEGLSNTVLADEKLEDLSYEEAKMIYDNGLIIKKNGKEYSVYPKRYASKPPTVTTLEFTGVNQLHLGYSEFIPAWEDLIPYIKRRYPLFGSYPPSFPYTTIMEKLV